MVKVLSQQSLLDLAIQIAGSPEAVIELAIKNDLSITDDLTAGNDILDDIGIVNTDIAGYYANKKLTPATWSEDEIEEIAGEGIEFWAIEYDFIVS